MILKKHIIVTMLAAALPLMLQAGFQSPSINLSSGKDMNMDDECIASKSLTLTCQETFQGRGYLKSPLITITANKFDFKGTIHCTGTCHITAKERFNEKMFKRDGGGQFIITVDPQLSLQDKNRETDFHHIPSPAFPQPTRPSVSRKIEIDGSVFTISGEVPLAIAEGIQKGDTATVMTALENSPLLKNNKEMMTIFMLMAGLSGNIPLAKEFIQLGAQVNGTDSKYGGGQPHLITAVIAKRADFVTLLVAAGAQPNVKNKDWIPALVIAVLQQDLNTVNALLQAPGIDLNLTDSDRHTALMHAAGMGEAEIVKVLLKAGANFTLQSSNRATALDYARHNKQVECAHLLKEKETEQSKKDETIIKKYTGIDPLTLIGTIALCGIGSYYIYGYIKSLKN